MKNENSIKKPFYKQVFPMLAFVILTIYSISFLAPIAWTIITSLKSYGDYAGTTIVDMKINGANFFGLPRYNLYVNTWNFFQNYITANTYVPGSTRLCYDDGNIAYTVPQILWFTVLYSVGCTVFATVIQAVSAYIAARYSHYKVPALLYPIVIVTMLMPIVGSLPSSIAITKSLNLYDSMVGMWVMQGSFLGANFLIFYGTFKGISWEYAEAAFIDGASHFRVLIQIMIPLATTTVTALMLMSFIGYWNNWQVTIQFLPHYPVISYALYNFAIRNLSTDSAFDYPAHMAGCITVALPMLLVFILLRKKLMGNISLGGIKG